MFTCVILVAFAGLVVVYAQNIATLTAAEKAVFLNEHNVPRAAVKSKPLIWNDTLSISSGKYGSGCVFAHSKGNYGENLYAGYPVNNNHTALASNSVKMWVAEIKVANPPTWTCMTSSTTCGHYTQVVWNTTTSVGCAIVHCTGAVSNYVICQYWPRGNILTYKPYI